MPKSKSVFMMLLCLVLSSNMAAQDLIGLFFPDKTTAYMGVTLDNGKTRSGLGVLRLKNNGLYVGYFSHNKFNGKGMQIAPKDKTIENCGEGFIYIGRWLNGKKYGNGRLYNKLGQLIYNGRFENDKPCGQLLSCPDTLRKFSFLKFNHDDESEIFVGEVTSDLPNGFGIYYDGDSFTIVESKEGIQYGLGLMLFPSVGWSTFKVENGLYTELDNSANLSNRRERRKEESRKARQKLLNAFENFTIGMAQVASNVQQIKNGGNATSSYGSTSSSEESSSLSMNSSLGNANDGAYTSSSASGGGGSLEDQYKQWERRAIANYNSLTNLGARVKKNGKDSEGSTGQSISSSNYTGQKKALREAQSEMKMIRQKASKQGIIIKKSDYEDVVVNY